MARTPADSHSLKIGAVFNQAVDASNLPADLAAAFKAFRAELEKSALSEQDKAKVAEDLDTVLAEAKEPAKANPGKVKAALKSITDTVAGATHLLIAGAALAGEIAKIIH
ncbi:MAG: hypothetical protein AB7G38_14550 [Dehalococcoidia bacterium]